MSAAKFIIYFLEFYGAKGLYPIAGLTKQEIKAGVMMRGKNFEGDSIDREAIRDMILVNKGRLAGYLGIGLSECGIQGLQVSDNKMAGHYMYRGVYIAKSFVGGFHVNCSPIEISKKLSIGIRAKTLKAIVKLIDKDLE